MFGHAMNTRVEVIDPEYVDPEYADPFPGCVHARHTTPLRAWDSGRSMFVPVVTDVCGLCKEPVSLLDATLTFDRVNGNSNYGFEPLHKACVDDLHEELERGQREYEALPKTAAVVHPWSTTCAHCNAGLFVEDEWKTCSCGRLIVAVTTDLLLDGGPMDVTHMGWTVPVVPLREAQKLAL